MVPHQFAACSRRECSPLSTVTERVSWRVDDGSGTLSRMDEIGFGVEDVAPARRALFELAVSQADRDADFAANRDAWLEALWSQLAELLGWDPGPWDAYLPSDAMAT